MTTKETMTPTWFFKKDKFSELMKVSMGSIFFQKGPEYAPTAEKRKGSYKHQPKGASNRNHQAKIIRQYTHQ